jgi:AhpD family alkylhydroperoxidase
MLYRSCSGMGDLDADRGLHRTQMELVAARVSLLDDCLSCLFAHAGMLRTRAERTGRRVDLSAIAHPERDSLLPAGREPLEFVTALIRGAEDLPATRDRLTEAAGTNAAVRAAAVGGNFQMMNRLVDATGVPIGPTLRAIAADLDLPT